MPVSLRIALTLLVADGVAALYLGDLLGPIGAVVVAAGLAASWAPWLRARATVSPLLGRVLVLVAALASALDLAVLAATLLDASVRLLCFLVLYKLATIRTVRETRTVGFLALFMLALASVTSLGVGYVFVFVTFVLLTSWVAILQQVLLEEEPSPGRAIVGTVAAGRRLFAVAAAATGAAVVVTAILFFFIPRIGLAALPLRARAGPMLTGFSDRVELGAWGQIETDDSVVMRVRVPEWISDPDRLPDLRWRGVALDVFDGRAWTAGRPARAPLPCSYGGEFPVGIPRGTGRILIQEIQLEPLGTDVIFAAPRVLHLRVRGAGGVRVDDMGGFAAPNPASRLSYTVYSELDEGFAGRPWIRPAPPLDEDQRARYVQLPRVPGRVVDLARQVAGESDDPQQVALRLTAFLSRNYRYTLSLDRQTGLDPIEEFLFVRQSGNCEYFAASLAVMLRSLGIPARVVNGFQRGEWNPYGRYFMVRLRDAHSWVEAYVGRFGWMMLDPSPRLAVPPGEWGGIFLYLDALRMRWHRYVINWSLRDQFEFAAGLRRMTAGWREWLAVGDAGAPGRLRDLATGVVLAAGLVFALRLWRGGAGRAGKRGGAPPRFYARAMRGLARRGLTPEPGETAREFALRVARLVPPWAAPLAALTAAYERCRFGAATLTAQEHAELDAHLRALDRRPRRAG
jgi:protein-glutamine gamma-glutamyltransferase